MDDLYKVRKDYSMHVMLESNVHDNPIDQFAHWLKEAQEKDPDDYNAMTLSTIDAHGFPNQRIVLLREFSQKGVVFYTNYASVKGKEIDVDPKVGLNFFWKELERQVRMKGEARKLPAAVSDAYFASRPRENQISAWASEQSVVISSREALEKRLAEIEARFEGVDVPRPPHWGGYQVFPISFEFWQGRPGRLHDRILYRCDADGEWFLERLAP
jgi:pyridoxamine 5'-phosphate oxidase